MNTVEPLQENGTSLICVGASQALAAPVRHLVAEVKPLFFHQDLEALQCPAEKDNVPNTHKRAAKKFRILSSTLCSRQRARNTKGPVSTT